MMFNQIRISLKAAQASLDRLCDAATSNRDVMIIERPAGTSVALIAADELSSLIETVYLLKSHRNAGRLLAALRRAQRGSREESKKT